MTIRTIDTIIDVADDHSAQLQLPADIPVGRHRLIAIINEESASETSPPNGAWSFPHRRRRCVADEHAGNSGGDVG